MITLDEVTEIAILAMDFRTEKQAIKAVEYMEANGLDSAVAVGHYGLQSIPKGTRVRLKAGSTFWSTHPKFRGQGRQTNERARYLTVFDVHNGYIDYTNIGRAEVRNPEIVWVGAGSYWFYADINDVEIVA